MLKVTNIYILYVLKLISDFLLIIFHFTNIFVIYLYPCTEIDVKMFQMCVSWLETFFINMCYKPITYENEAIF